MAMFNLEQAVDQWCAEICGVQSNSDSEQSNLDELKDHLYCMVEHFQGQGMDDEEAFNAARDALGETQSLKTEFARTHSWNTVLCAKLEDHQSQVMSAEAMQNSLTKAIVANAIIWAAAIIGTALLLRGSDSNESVVLMLVILATISFTQIQTFGKKIGININTASQEWRWLRAKLKKLSS
jgi:hypothetical protein